MRAKPTILQTATAVATTGFILTLSSEFAMTGKPYQRAEKAATLLATEAVTTLKDLFIKLPADATASKDISLASIASNRLVSVYESLRDAWFNDPSLIFSSFSEDFTQSDDFRGLVRLGKAIYPFIIEDLDPETAIRWDLVLTQIHGQSVVAEREWGKPDKIASRWIKFLRRSI